MFLPQQDQRSFKRMAMNLPIRITKDALEVAGICKDLSSSGMLINFTDQHLQAGDVVQLTLTTSNQRFAPLKAQATLLRVNKQQIGFEAAVSFITIK